MMNELRVSGIVKEFEGKTLLRAIDFTVSSGQTLCLLGKSGSGKSTILRIIAGIEKPDQGKILWNGDQLNDVPVHKRNFGLMFQDYALFPHLSVWENVAFGLRMHGMPREERENLVKEALAQVNMSGFAHRRVTDLSGGEQQRIALARSLAAKPALLMLDEPLAALDQALRVDLQEEVRSTLHNAAIPVIYVTHDQEEAVVVGDHLALLHDGVIVQAGETEQVYRQPVNQWAAEFLGLTNFLSGEVVSLDPLEIKTNCGILLPGSSSKTPVNIGQQVTLLLLPTGITLNLNSENQNLIKGKIISSVFRGTHYRLSVQVCGGQEFGFISSTAFHIDAEISISLSDDSVVIVQ